MHPKNSERQAANSKKEKYPPDRWDGLASPFGKIDFHYSRCC
jgi:hypothetical protein